MACLKVIKIVHSRKNQDIKMKKISNTKNIQVKVNRVIIQQRESICEDKQNDRSIE